MFDYVRELPGNHNVIVGKVIDGRRVGLYDISLSGDRPDDKDWCRDHGMTIIARVPNIEKTRWFEIWANDRMMTAFII